MIIRSTAAILAAVLCCAGIGSAAQPVVFVDGNLVLTSLISLSDAHMQATLERLEGIAATPEARAGNWAQLRAMLAEMGHADTFTGPYYAQATGAYWTLDKGFKTTNVADRPYFKRAQAGLTTIGDLLVSRSTSKEIAVITAPIRNNGHFVGLVGVSVYLDVLSTMLTQETGIGGGTVYWAVDSHGIIALHSDTSNIFVDPAKLSPELKRVTAEMLAGKRGVETYTYRGKKRTIVYGKSNLTGWTFGFGIVHS